MISAVQSLHVGNALRLFIEPPPGAAVWRILRKGSDTFTGPDDASALVAYEGDEKVVVDAQALTNEVMAFYRPFYTADGTTWTPGATANGTPVADYAEYTTDAMSLLRERLEAGLKVECERGTFAVEMGYIQVLTAPPVADEQTRFPLVSIHLESEDPSERAIGENISGDEFDPIGFSWDESEGWLATVRLTVIGWSLNPDERLELRKAIRRVVIGNLPVFSSKGIEQVSLSQQDIDSISGEYAAPIFQAMGTFSCLAPTRVGGATGAIAEVISRSING